MADIAELAQGLTINTLASRTGVPQATLRTWESRYNALTPNRSSGGHRRYDENDVALIAEIVRQRAGGLAMDRAVTEARARTENGVPSIHTGLRASHPELVPSVLSKALVSALTRSIEDEYCARAEHPVLFAAFQRAEFFRQSELRWTDLAATARSVVVFADFGRRARSTKTFTKIDLPSDSIMRREWLLVCDAPDYPACLSAWELPGQPAQPDFHRRFEVVWSIDARVVRRASQLCLALARRLGEPLDSVVRLEGQPATPSPDVTRASGLLTRALQYVDLGHPVG